MTKVTQEEEVGSQLFSYFWRNIKDLLVSWLFNPFPVKFIVLAAFSAQVVAIQAGGPVVRTVASVAP